MSRRRALAVPALVASAGLTLAVSPVPSSADETSDSPAKVLLMLDSSGSMNEKDASAPTKLAAAKTALGTAVDALPSDAQVGLRVYGATVDVDKPTPASCQDTQLVAPLATKDAAALKKTIDGFKATGDTPMAHSLIQGIKDLGTDGKRHIILVSDGQDNCSKNPCDEVAKALDGSGVDLQVDTVGLAVDAKTRSQLQCIANAGKGHYYDAKDGASLNNTLGRLSTRAARQFAVAGTPVTGTRTADQAPEISKGQYVDKLVVPPTPNLTQDRWYKVKRTIPGSTLRVNVLGRSAPLPNGPGSNSQWETVLLLDDGTTECGGGWELGGDATSGDVMSTTMTAMGLHPETPATDTRSRPCAAADELLVHLKVRTGYRQAAEERTPVELRVIEEPPVTNLDELPEAVTETYARKEVPSPTKKGAKFTKVVGGASFNDAMAVEPGSYVVDLVPSERAFFTMPLDWGQGATFAVEGVPDGYKPPVEMFLVPHVPFHGDVYAPDLGKVNSDELTTKQFSMDENLGIHPLVRKVPSVRYANRWGQAMNYERSIGHSMAGNFYFTVAVGTDMDGAELAGHPIPVRFTITRDGAVEGTPTFDTDGVQVDTSPSATPSEASESGAGSTPSSSGGTEQTGSSGGVGKGVIGGAVLATVAACVAGAFALSRRKR